MNIGKLLNLFAKSIKHNNLDNLETKALNILNDILNKISISENVLAIDILETSTYPSKKLVICRIKKEFEVYHEMICKKYTNTYIINNVNRNDYILKYKTHNIYYACIAISLLSIRSKFQQPYFYKANNPNVSIKELYRQRYISEFERITKELSERRIQN